MRIIAVCIVLLLSTCDTQALVLTYQAETRDPNSSDVSAENADRAVNRMMASILRRGEGRTDSGIRTTTWVPPTENEAQEIERIGIKAIDPLSAYLNSEEPRVQLLAVRLLGAIGGREILPAIKQALEPGRWVVIRTQALTVLLHVPRSEAVPLIHEVIKRDQDPQVQARGRDILAAFGEQY